MITQFKNAVFGNGNITTEHRNEVLHWIDHNLNNYLNKCGRDGSVPNMNITEIEHIIDFLMSDKAPSRLRKMSYEEALKSSENWMRTLINKAGQIVETEEDVKIVKDFGDGFKLVRLKGENAFKREGKLMSHCVAAYYGKKGTRIYSLRDIENKPHCTIEVTVTGEGKEKQVNQVKGKGNGSIHPLYVKYILSILIDFFKMPIRDSEMSNLGYLKLEPEYLKVMEDIYDSKSIKYVIFNNQKYFYKYSNLKVK